MYYVTHKSLLWRNKSLTWLRLTLPDEEGSKARLRQLQVTLGILAGDLAEEPAERGRGVVNI